MKTARGFWGWAEGPKARASSARGNAPGWAGGVGTVDAGTADAGPVVAGPADAGTADAGPNESDAAAPPRAVPWAEEARAFGPSTRPRRLTTASCRAVRASEVGTRSRNAALSSCALPPNRAEASG